MPIEANAPMERDMQIEKHGNVWMLIRRNSEGAVSVIRSFRTERAALNAMGRLS